MLRPRIAAHAVMMGATIVALSCSAGAQSPVVFTSVATGLSSPVDIQHAPGDSTRLFIVQQGGLLRVIENGVLLPTPALNVSTRIITGGERGFLGLAFDPLWPDSAYIYVNFTRSGDGANSVVRYSRSTIGTGVTFDPASERVLMAIPDFASNHNAGALAFGNDGYLYITTGDGGSGGDPQNNGQTLTTLLGKILRIDVRGTQATSECAGGSTNYGIPPDNPFVGSTTAACDEIYAYGLRNPWRMSFDRLTDELWLGDVGQELWEEIDVIQNGGNYGWRRMEGAHCFNPSSNCQTGSLILPIWEYSSGSGSGNCSVTGGYVYRGANVPDLAGQYVFADYCSGRVWALDMTGPSPASTQIGTRSNPTTFGEDYHGEIYVVGGSSVFRLDPNPVSGEPAPDESAVQLSLVGPNPVRSRATIRFQAGLAGPARMTLFDVLGREVAVLFERVVDGTSPQEVTLRADRMPPGVYVVRLVTAAGLRTMEVVLAR